MEYVSWVTGFGLNLGHEKWLKYKLIGLGLGRRRKRERRMMNRNIQEEDYLDSMKLLELQITKLDNEGS